MVGKKLLVVGIAVFLSMSVRERDKPYVLGLSLSTLKNPFFASLKKGAEKKAALLNVKLKIVSGNNNKSQERTNIQKLIDEKVDALLINPTDSDAIAPSVFIANSRKIPVFMVDRAASAGKTVSLIASDNEAGGRTAGQFLSRRLKGKGNVVELEGIAGTSAARDRGLGFNRTIAKFRGIKVISRKTANFNRGEARGVFANILDAHPKIDGVFAHNDEMVLGAIQAAQATGRMDKIIFVGFDATKDALAAVKKGTLAATIAQRAEEIGKLAVEAAIRSLNGEKIAPFIPVPLALVAGR